VSLWIVGVFNQADLEAVHEISPAALEADYFSKWEQRLLQQEPLQQAGGAPLHLNNPKIPLNFIMKHGVQVWPPTEPVPAPSIPRAP
jgi:hypothetical protein